MKFWCAIAVVLVTGAACDKSSADKGALPPPSGVLPPPDVPVLADPAVSGSAASGNGQDHSGFRVTGTLHPRAEAQLGPKASGVLAAISVEEGDTVKKGQLLFRIDASQARLAVAQAETGLSSAKIGLASAELDYKRTKELLDRGSVPQATFDQAKTRYDSAKSSVEQAKVGLSQAKSLAGDTAVRSPISGVVTQKLKNLGETVTMMPPTIVLIVQDTGVLELRARFPESALSQLAAGKQLSVTMPALKLSRDVKVKRIGQALDARTRTVEVFADLDNADGLLRAGMLAEVDLGDSADAADKPRTAAAPKGKEP